MAQLLTRDQVAHVAHLARLSLSDQELITYTDQLSAILAYVDQLSSVDTEHVVPVAQVTGLENVLQADAIASDTVDRESFLQGAPAAEPPYVKVKAVLE
jgi:aspartyl-tRNA(Asn)/glutamyl-tRNA(Gln) amidotransferase subunit C